ncbi:hypothetical protein MANES_11G120950v8 [Manihot esculenta]|uniref:Uncharacterized protein n=1 Tax=Manihot esculenta TaxID=3983 RepID=A0ACB7GVU0_MANES|nr:hypothetical protein MANES_11G120950v8 [Manihot esculenta]
MQKFNIGKHELLFHHCRTTCIVFCCYGRLCYVLTLVVSFLITCFRFMPQQFLICCVIYCFFISLIVSSRNAGYTTGIGKFGIIESTTLLHMRFYFCILRRAVAVRKPTYKAFTRYSTRC